MASLIDDVNNSVVDIPCPSKCSGIIKEKIGRLKMEPILRCRTCGVEFSLDHKQVRELASEVEKALAAAKHKIGGK